MEALILASAVLALARYFGKKSEAPETSSADQPTAPPAIVRDPPPPPPPPPPSGPFFGPHATARTTSAATHVLISRSYRGRTPRATC
jgi:hypothetical protein